MKKDNKKNKNTKMEVTIPRMKQLVMTFHPASCRSIQNTILQLRNDIARTAA